MTYEENRVWSDRFIPQIKRIVGPHLIVQSSFEVDTKQAADLVVLTARDLTIACRIRRHGYAERYPHEFTIRSAYDSGAKTELQKFTEGWGDWMFYGHAAQSGPTVERWMLIDLSAWRAALIRHRDQIVFHKRSNGDGTHFVAFDASSFPQLPNCKPLLIASSHPVQEPQEELW